MGVRSLWLVIGVLSLAVFVLGTALADARARLSLLESDTQIAPDPTRESGYGIGDVEFGRRGLVRDSGRSREDIDRDDHDCEEVPDPLLDMSRGLADLEIGGGD